MVLSCIILAMALALATPTTALAAEASVVTLLRQSQQAAALGYNEAMALVTQAMAQDPAYPPLWNQKATLQLRTKDYAGAAETLAVALKVEPNNPETNILTLAALLRLDEKAGGKDPALARRRRHQRRRHPNPIRWPNPEPGPTSLPGSRFGTRPGPRKKAATLLAGYAAGDHAAMEALAGAAPGSAPKDVLGALQFYAGKDMLAQKRLDLAQKA